MIRIALAIISLTFTAVSYAQNVFTYGRKTVSKEEFIRAFNKNPVAGSDRKKALREYLDLYINFKLKVQAANDAGLDKDPAQKAELQNFKKQIADNLINEEANVKALVREAFDRSQKDIHLQEVFVQVQDNADTTKAFNAIQAAYKQLKDGKEFTRVAQEFAVDDETKQSKGELGYITVFTLPYEIESRVYNLTPNSFSAPFRSKAGYHIFKNAGERKSQGTRKVAQILISIPPNATDDDWSAISVKADSIYNLLKSGTGFAELATAVSNDVSTSNNGGELPEFAVGTYDAQFENAAFALKNAGDISKPFRSAYGYHIIKLIEAKPVSPDPNDAVAFASLQEKVVNDHRLDLAKRELIQKKFALIKFKPSVIKANDLCDFADNVLKAGKTVVVKGIRETTPIFSFASQTIKAGDWVNYVKKTRNTQEAISRDRYLAMYKEFVAVAAEEYYRSNLTQFNSDYVKQLKEFEEANLLFGIMEKKVWGKANTDSVGLLHYYNQHKSKYVWGPSADAIMVTCNKEKDALEAQKKLKNNVGQWRGLTVDAETGIIADSARYELAQLPGQDKASIEPGLITAFDKNQSEGTYTFTYIIKVYNQSGQRSFEDARGLVISDYQQLLEENWIRELKKKYPVKVNENVFQSIK